MYRTGIFTCVDPDQYGIRNINTDSQKYQIMNTDTAWIQIYNTDSYHLTATLLEDVLGPEGVAARDGQVQHRVALH